jgi:hypothetical protein
MNACEPHVDVICASGVGCIGATTRDSFVGVGARAETQVLRCAQDDSASISFLKERGEGVILSEARDSALSEGPAYPSR